MQCTVSSSMCEKDCIPRDEIKQLIQILILLLLSCGIWAYLSGKILKSKTMWLITSLAGSALILNPWQYENLGLEFQTPLIFINTFTLFSAVVITFEKKE